MKNFVYGIVALVTLLGGDSLLWNGRVAGGFVMCAVGGYLIGKLAWKAAQWDDATEI